MIITLTDFFHQGLGATSIGYFFQGACMVYTSLFFHSKFINIFFFFFQIIGKFGLYEYFKNLFLSVSNNSKQNPEKIHILILFLSSALAEIAASWVLCPLEVAKITIVTNPTGFKLTTISALSYIISKDGVLGLFKGLPLILLRQVPYTCCKLAGYEIISDMLYYWICKNSNHSSNNKICNIRNDHHNCNQINSNDSCNHREESLSTTTQETIMENSILNEINNKHKIVIEKDTTGWIPFISGICAGVFAAIVSHPADVLLSMSCQTNANFCIDGNLKGLITVINAFKSLGLKGCYAGLLPRAFMIGLITAAQFFVYEKVKKIFLAQRE